MAAGMSSCSSHRNATSQSQPSAPKKVKAKSIPETAALAQTYSSWETFYAPFNLKIVRPTSFSVSGRATMVRNQYIRMSMRMLGFEVAVVHIDSDSIYIADKYHKSLVVAPFSALTANTGLTVGDIQDIILGRAFYPGMGTLCDIEIPEILFSPSQDGDLTILMPRRLPEGAKWFFTIDSGPEMRRITVEPEGFPTFTADYGAVRNSEAGAVATDIMVEGAVDDKPIEAMFQWIHSKAKWNQSVSDPSIEFSGYRRLSADQLIQSLKQM